MNSRGAWYFGVLLLTLFPELEGKLQRRTLQLEAGQRVGHWQYVSKFGYAIGTGTYSMRLRSLDPSKHVYSNSRFSLLVYLDEEWSRVDSLPNCDHGQFELARRTELLDLPGSGNWGNWNAGQLYQTQRPHIWYFVISDCGRMKSNTTSYDIEVEFTAHQFDDSEFSVEMRYMLFAHCVGLLVFGAFLYCYVGWCREFVQSMGQLHPIIQVLSGGMILQFLSQILHMCHLGSYSSDGMGIRSADVISEVFLTLSQVTQTTLLISIALGYTLLPGNRDTLQLVKHVAALVLFIHAGLVAFGKMQDDEHFKYHENEGAVGWVLLGIRLLLYTWFMFGINNSQEKGGFRLHTFLQQFKVAGSLYFVAYPLFFCVVQLFAPYLQHPILQVGVLTMQSASNIWLANLFFERGGSYFKLSSLNSALLPGGSPGPCSGKVH